MSTKWRGGSSSHPAVRHRSGSIACSTMAGLVFLEERPDLRGRQRNRPRHDELVRLEAPRRRGPRRGRQQGEREQHEPGSSHVLTIPSGSASGASAGSARPTDPHRCAACSRRVSSFGVSSSIGRPANRGSFSSRRNGSSPRHPLPMCSCRSTRLPHGFFESFRWKTRTRSSPTMRVELAEGCLVSRFGADVVAGGQQVTGVEAHADPRRSVQPIEDGRQVLEAVSEIGPLAGGVLEQHHRPCARPLREQRPIASPIRRSPSCFRPGRVRARVHDETVESERLGPVDSSPSAAIDCARSVGGAAARLIR